MRHGDFSEAMDREQGTASDATSDGFPSGAMCREQRAPAMRRTTGSIARHRAAIFSGATSGGAMRFGEVGEPRENGQHNRNRFSKHWKFQRRLFPMIGSHGKVSRKTARGFLRQKRIAENGGVIAGPVFGAEKIRRAVCESARRSTFRRPQAFKISPPFSSAGFKRRVRDARRVPPGPSGGG